MQTKISAVFMRGGTSRAVCFREDVLVPYPPPVRERIILAALGSPDVHGRQIDGLGGGISSLSKVVIVGRSTEADSDIIFTFGQVDVRTPHIDWSGTCGNMAAAVGPFAIDEGLIPALEPVTSVRVFSTNTGKRYIAHVPVYAGQAAVEGEYMVDGVPAPGACITLEYPDPGGSLGGELLPTGLPRQQCELADSRVVTISIVDAAIPTVFVRANELGADATQLAPALDAEQALQQTLEEIRCRSAVLLGLTPSLEEAHEQFQHIPKVVLVAPPATYLASSGKVVDAESVDLLARAISVRNTHRTLPGTVAMCTALTAQVEGTVVYEVTRRTATHGIRIGHPAGVMEVGATVLRRDGEWYAERVTTKRTARRIMEGSVLVPQRYLDGTVWFGAEKSDA